MKWRSHSNFIKHRYYEIEYDPAVGFYLYVFENGGCIYDELQDTLEVTMERARKYFEVPKNTWIKIEE